MRHPDTSRQGDIQIHLGNETSRYILAMRHPDTSRLSPKKVYKSILESYSLPRMNVFAIENQEAEQVFKRFGHYQNNQN